MPFLAKDTQLNLFVSSPQSSYPALRLLQSNLNMHPRLSPWWPRVMHDLVLRDHLSVQCAIPPKSHPSTQSNTVGQAIHVSYHPQCDMAATPQAFPIYQWWHSIWYLLGPDDAVTSHNLCIGPITVLFTSVAIVVRIAITT